ncbi:MAG: hypothetical protein HYY34_06330 [Chloroflexi bacterium]|nr:hypothetical protein [Chloroflexota bacterium]
MALRSRVIGAWKASVPLSGAAAEWTWVVARSVVVAVMAAGLAFATPGPELTRWVIGVAAGVTLYNALLSVMLARGGLKPAIWVGLALDTIAFGTGWWVLATAQARGAVSIDLYVLIAFPAALVGAWRLGWLLGLAFLTGSVGWIAWVTMRYFPSDGEAAAQLPWRLLFVTVTALLATWLVARLVAAHRSSERFRGGMHTLTQVARVVTGQDDLEARLSATWAIIADAIPFDRISIARADSSHGTIQEMYAFPGSAGPARIRPLNGTAGERVVGSRRGVLADPFGPASGESSQGGFAPGVRAQRSFVCVPVLWQSRVAAFLTMAADAERAYTEWHLELAERIGSVLAPLIVELVEPDAEGKTDGRAEVPDQTRRALVYAVAHHLRTPMTAIKVSTEMLENEVFRGDYPAQLRHQVNLLKNGVGRLEILVGDSLEYLAATQRATVLEKIEVDMALLLRRVVESFEPAFYARHHRIQWVQQDEQAICLADPIHLDRCLIHLVGLASQLTPDGEEIAVRLSRFERSCIVEISAGRWRPKVEDLDAMFVAQNPATREPVPAAGTAGMFLGFAIARAIANAHGGSLDAVDQSGKGATFRLQIEAPPYRPTMPGAMITGSGVG